jgi:hypothetical protein
MMPEDFVPPEYHLIQKSSSGVNGQPGQFWNSVTQATKDQIHAHIVTVTAIRTKWGTDNLSSDPPECTSDNAATFKSKDGKDCLKCPYRCEDPWNYSADERRTKCLKGFLIIGIDRDEQEPFLMRISGISTQPIKEFATNLRFRAAKGNLTPPSVLLKSIPKSTQYGTTYVVQPIIEGTLSDEDIKKISPIVSELIHLPNTRVLELSPNGKIPEPDPKPLTKTQNEYLDTFQADTGSNQQVELDF